MFKKLTIVLSMLIIGLVQSNSALAAGKMSVDLYTLPFGTPSYLLDTAVESLFGELKDTHLSVKIKQTPGAMYIIRRVFEDQDKIASGAAPQILSGSSDAIHPFVVEGRPPFTKFPLPRARVLWGTVGVVHVFVTFDKTIKTPADLAGKKVGFAEKARVFSSSLPNMPYFNKGYGGYNKVKWQHLGAVNSKDALLSGAIDVHWGMMVSKFVKDPTGKIVALAVVPAPPMMELMSSGRKLYFVEEDPAITKSSYDPATDQVMVPVMIRKGAIKGLDKAIWVRGYQGTMTCDATMPEAVAEELVLKIWKNMKRLSEYQKMFMLYPANPVPMTVPKKWIHPGTFKAAKKLGF